MSETFKIILAGQEYDCPALKYGAIRKGAFGAIRKLAELHRSAKPEDLGDPMSDMFEEITEHITTVFRLALATAYPQVTSEWMDDNLEFTDINAMLAGFPRLMRISGFEDSGEATSGSKSVSPEEMSRIGDG